MPRSAPVRHDVGMHPFDARGSAFTARETGLPWSSQAEVAQSQGLWDAAANLVAKVGQALVDGDDDRARRLAERAAAMPYDTREEVWPGVVVAAQEIFNTITDLVEEWPANDAEWVSILERVAQESDLARLEMRHVAAVLAHTTTLIEIRPVEQRRLARLAGGADGMAFPTNDLPRETHADAIIELARIDARVVQLAAELLRD